MDRTLAITPSAPLTYSSFFRLLKQLSPDVLHSQVALFCAIFRSYCLSQSSNIDYIWEPSHSSVNQIFQGKRRPSWPIFRYYCLSPGGSELLKSDAKYFAQLVAPTAKLLSCHIQQLTSLVTCAPNINPKDKEKVLQYRHDTSDDDLGDLIYRILMLLFREK